MVVILESEEEFLLQCKAAGQILEHAKTEEDDATLWFFDECWADWGEGRLTAFFASSKTPEGDGNELSVEARKQPDGSWTTLTVKKVTGA